jgi:hypothetical protein
VRQISCRWFWVVWTVSLMLSLPQWGDEWPRLRKSGRYALRIRGKRHIRYPPAVLLHPCHIIVMPFPQMNLPPRRRTCLAAIIPNGEPCDPRSRNSGTSYSTSRPTRSRWVWSWRRCLPVTWIQWRMGVDQGHQVTNWMRAAGLLEGSTLPTGCSPSPRAPLRARGAFPRGRDTTVIPDSSATIERLRKAHSATVTLPACVR